MSTRIYLDYAATTPLRGEAREAMLPFLSHTARNASSVHAEGRAARAALDDARERVAACIGARAKEIVFTSGGSEADNLALIGTARALRSKLGQIAGSAAEHHAVLHAIDALAEEGYETALLPVDAQGCVQPEAFRNVIASKPTAIASVMLVNNELGTIAPIQELASIAHAHGALFHTDAVQAAAYLDLDAGRLGVDLLSLGAHKVYGPDGVGALYVREGTPIVPILHGGSQEFSKRAGTENLAAIAGFAAALELAVRERPKNAAYVESLRSEFEERVKSRISGVRINGAGAPRAPHISNLSFEGVQSEPLLVRLDLDGLAVSAGSACASGAIEASHVIRALGIEPKWTLGVLRFSFGTGTTREEIVRAVEVLERAVADLRSVSAIF